MGHPPRDRLEALVTIRVELVLELLDRQGRRHVALVPLDDEGHVGELDPVLGEQLLFKASAALEALQQSG